MCKADLITSCILILLAVSAGIESYGMEYMTPDGVPGPGFVPLWICILVILLSSLMLIVSIQKQKTADSKPVFDRVFFVNSLTLLGAAAVAMALVDILGMLVCIGLLTGFLSRVLGYRKWPMNISLAIGTPVLFWLLFTFALEVRFPEGILGF